MGSEIPEGELSWGSWNQKRRDVTTGDTFEKVIGRGRQGEVGREREEKKEEREGKKEKKEREGRKKRK